MGFIQNGLNRLTGATRKAGRNIRNATKNVVNNAGNEFAEKIKNVVKGVTTLLFPIIIKVLIVVVFFAAAWDVVSNLFVETSATSISSFVSASTSTQQLNESYEKTGSLVIATDDDIKNMATSYVADNTKGDLSYLKPIISSKISELVSNNSGIYLETSSEVDPIDLGEDFTVYEHILNTERYNFNRINWRKFTRGELQEGTPTLIVDSETRLQYPKDEFYDLNRFINMTRPYLQTWIIPMSMMSGIADNATNEDAKNFAYSVIAEGYHKIQIDQHSLDTKTRVNNYLIYDKTTTIINVKRTCTTYETTEEQTLNCTDDDYKNGTNGCKKEYVVGGSTKTVNCTDSDYATKAHGCKNRYTVTVGNRGNEQKRTCTDSQYASGAFGCKNKYEVSSDENVVSCTDTDFKNGTNGCKNQYTTTGKVTYEVCEDKEVVGQEYVDEDIRENISSTDSIETNYNYALTSVEAFDKLIINNYTFEKYYVDNSNYNEDLSKTDSHSSKEQDYIPEPEVTIDKNFKANTKTAPSGVDLSKLKIVDTNVKTIKYKTIVKKEGLEYTDTLVWRDKLEFDEESSSKQEGYTIEQLKEYIGEGTQLSSSEEEYYSELADANKLNRIDLLNSKKSIYTKYITTASSQNIGYKRLNLTTSYDVLKKNLSQLYTDYPYSIYYGQSIVPYISEEKSSYLSHNFEMFVGDINTSVAEFAASFEGKNLAYMESIDDVNAFRVHSHWCAMFVSYCMAKANIPVTWFAGCSTAWSEFQTKPGFYDIGDERARNAGYVTTDINHLASYEDIYPGDVILFRWNNEEPEYARSHAAICYSVERDENGKVVAIYTIDGNSGGSTDYDVTYVKKNKRTSLGNIVSFISIGQVLAEAEKGNTW